MDENNFSLLDELRECVIEDEARALGLENLDENTQILSVDQANFFLRRLEELKAEEEDINAICDNEIQRFTERVNKFREQKLHSVINTQLYFKKLLEKYAEAELAESNKKSIKLPFGTLQFRKTPTQYAYEDEKLLKYLKDHKLTNLVSMKESPNKAELKKVAELRDGKLFVNGIEVDGVTATEGGTNFDVKINS